MENFSEGNVSTKQKAAWAISTPSTFKDPDHPHVRIGTEKLSQKARPNG